jgi:hypothetical protein
VLASARAGHARTPRAVGVWRLHATQCLSSFGQKKGPLEAGPDPWEEKNLESETKTSGY